MLWKYNCEEWKYGILQQAASAADLLNPGSTFRPHRRRIIDNLTRRKASFQTLDKYNLTLYQAKIYISLDYQILNWIFVHKATKDIMMNVQIIRSGSVLPHDPVQLLKYFDVTSSHWCRCQVLKCASSSFSHPVVGGKWRAGRRFDILTLSFPKFTHQRWWMKEIMAAHEIYISHQLY